MTTDTPDAERKLAPYFDRIQVIFLGATPLCQFKMQRFGRRIINDLTVNKANLPESEIVVSALIGA
ncbi:MAG: hypothetical protein Q4P66_07885 [Actinomycetaceae bacterium]|nr:hypothetical protein [Actinomycetaceae bacterium]